MLTFSQAKANKTMDELTKERWFLRRNKLRLIRGRRLFKRTLVRPVLLLKRPRKLLRISKVRI